MISYLLYGFNIIKDISIVTFYNQVLQNKAIKKIRNVVNVTTMTKKFRSKIQIIRKQVTKIKITNRGYKISQIKTSQLTQREKMHDSTFSI